jgi:hypothetical protein
LPVQEKVTGEAKRGNVSFLVDKQWFNLHLPAEGQPDKIQTSGKVGNGLAFLTVPCRMPGVNRSNNHTAGGIHHINYYLAGFGQDKSQPERPAGWIGCRSEQT